MNLLLKDRKSDYIFIVFFSLFFITSMISDLIPTWYGELVPNHPNPLMQANYNYAKGCDPLFLHPPFWMRIVTGLSAFVYGPFYLLLVWAFIKGKKLDSSTRHYLWHHDQRDNRNFSVWGRILWRTRMAMPKSRQISAIESPLRNHPNPFNNSDAESKPIHQEVLINLREWFALIHRDMNYMLLCSMNFPYKWYH